MCVSTVNVNFSYLVASWERWGRNWGWGSHWSYRPRSGWRPLPAAAASGSGCTPDGGSGRSALWGADRHKDRVLKPGRRTHTSEGRTLSFRAFGGSERGSRYATRTLPLRRLDVGTRLMTETFSFSEEMPINYNNNVSFKSPFWTWKGITNLLSSQSSQSV